MMKVSFDPFPILETDRLILRRVGPEDAEQIFLLRSNPESMRYVPRPLTKTIEDARTHIALIESRIVSNEGINWAITLKDNPTFIGIIGHYVIRPEHYRAEIGYMILHEFQNMGIISEAIAKVVEYGFREMKLHSIEAIIDPQNRASAKVLEKNHFVMEAHLKENEFYDGKFLDTMIYSLINPE